MVQHRAAADQHEVGPMRQAALRGGGVHDLAGHAQAGGAAGQGREMVDQRPVGIGRVLRRLEAVPQRHVQIVELALGQHLGGQRQRFRHRDAEALGRQPQAQLEGWPGAGAHTVDDAVQHPAAVGEAAAIAVGALVVLAIEELRQQVAVGAVQLHAVEAGAFGPHGGGDEVGDQLLHLGGGQRTGAGLGIVPGADGLLTGQRAVGPAARMLDLQRRTAATGVDAGGQARQPGQVVVRPHAQLAGKALAAALHMGGAGHGEGEAAAGAHRQPVVLRVGQRAIGIALPVGQRRQHEAVGHGRAAGEGEGVAQLGCWVGHGLHSVIGRGQRPGPKVDGCTPAALARRLSSHQPAAGGTSWNCGSAPSFCAASSGQLGL